MRLQLQRYLSYVFLAFGIGLAVHTNWLQIKAWCAQQLIAQTWQQTLLGDKASTHKPWHWADFSTVAKLSIEGLEPLYVLSGAYGQSLAFGPGHMSESAAPGHNGQVIIAGHKDSHFAFLENSQLGDDIALQDKQGNTRHYKIAQKTVVDSEQQTLQISTRDELVLITCYPFDSITINGPLRLMVTAIPIS